MMDESLSLLKDGYRFILRRRQRKAQDFFETRVLLKKTLCMGGREAARLFYDDALFQRAHAVPLFVQTSLFGKGAIQTMDGAAHLHRKNLFLPVTGPDDAARLETITIGVWQAVLPQWLAAKRPVVLFEAAADIITRAICDWAGVALPGKDVKARSRDFIAMIDAFGSFYGPRYWRGHRARRRAEAWMESCITESRNTNAAAETPLARFAQHRGLDGALLSASMAAKEMLNVLRPSVAVAYFVTFAALTLYHQPAFAARLRTEPAFMDNFIHEIRRFYPFAPFLGAVARRDGVAGGCPFHKGQLVLIDLYGTDHDGKIWDRPDEFLPDRFDNWLDDRFSFIPQGGGDAATGHRCPGEGFTEALLRAALRALLSFSYDVPAQDLSFSLSRMPTYPKSRFILLPRN